MIHDYKYVEAAISDLKAGNVSGIAPAIKFLKADVYEHGSGYMKEYLWRYLLRVPLTDRQTEQLLKVAQKYLQRRMTREFRSMCRLVRRIANAEFRASVRDLIDSPIDKEMKVRATLLDAYLRSLSAGESMRIRSGKVIQEFLP